MFAADYPRSAVVSLTILPITSTISPIMKTPKSTGGARAGGHRGRGGRGARPGRPAPGVERLRRAAFFDDPLLPLAVRRIARHGAMATPHGHEFHELVVIVDGWGRHWVDGREREIGAGDVFVLTGRMTHHYPAVADLSLVNLLYDPARLGMRNWDLGTSPGYQALFEVGPRIGPDGPRGGAFPHHLRLDLDELAAVLSMIGEIEAELRRRAGGFRFMAITHFLRLIGSLARLYSRRAWEGRRPVSQLSRALSHMETHFAEPLTIAALSRVACMSPTNLLRRFREVVGHSPMAYLTRLRVQRGQRLLRHGDLSITEIGLATGFCDGNYFARQFRKVTGMTPREYRARARAGEPTKET